MNSLVYRNREQFTFATREGIKMTDFLHVPLIGGLVALAGGVVAEVANTDYVSQGGLWVGLAGLVTAIGAVFREYLGDRQKNRDFEITRLRIKLRADQNRRVFLALHKWAEGLPARVPGLPPPPDLPDGYGEPAEEADA